jgi:hypothetical protein
MGRSIFIWAQPPSRMLPASPRMTRLHRAECTRSSLAVCRRYRSTIGWRRCFPDPTKAAGVTPHSVFLCADCIVPEGMGMIQEPFGGRWVNGSGYGSCHARRQIRAWAGISKWLHDSASRRGAGRSDQAAIRIEIVRAFACERTFQRCGIAFSAHIEVLRLTKISCGHVEHAGLPQDSNLAFRLESHLRSCTWFPGLQDHA